MFKKHYKAFISYSQDDEAFASWFHKELEKYKIPKKLREDYPNLPKTLYPIFRDKFELSAGDDLEKEIPKALKTSDVLIVICSENAVKSEWVNKEILDFKKMYPNRKILPIIKDGARIVEDVFPKALKYEFDENGNPTDKRIDILAGNVNKESDGRELAKLRVISGILNIDLEELRRRDLEQERLDRNKFIAVWSLVSLVILGFAIFSWYQREIAVENKDKMSKAIFETSAIYAQFLLTSQNDYGKWSKATSKIINIMNKKDVEKSMKINDILAEYISLKGFNHERAIHVLPFYENPKYFLKTLFFRNTKYTTGYIEDRYLSLFLLHDLEFPAKLFLFLSNPPIKLPKIYQRMQNAVSTDLERYGYFLEAMNYESKNQHTEALQSLKKASKLGFFHSLTGSMSVFYLDSNYEFLYIFDDENLKKDIDKAHRLMTTDEKENLIKNINLFYLLAISFSQENQKYLRMQYSTDNEVLLWQSIQEGNYGKISYKNIVDYIVNNIDITNNKELKNFVYTLQQVTLTEKEILEQTKYKSAQEKLDKEYKEEISDALKQNKLKKQSPINKLIDKVINLKSKEFTNRFLQYSYLSTKDIREIDILIAKLSKRSINKIKIDLDIPKNITTAKEIRIYISKQTRPYNFDLAMYNRFITNKKVFKTFNDIYEKEPNNLHIQFALSQYWKIKGNNKNVNEYSIKKTKHTYFKNLETIFLKLKEQNQ